jgi:hypothetical protein
MPLVYFIIIGSTKPAIKTTFFSTGGEHLKAKEKIQVFLVTFFFDFLHLLLYRTRIKQCLSKEGNTIFRLRHTNQYFCLLNPSTPPKQLKKNSRIGLTMHEKSSTMVWRHYRNNFSAIYIYF